MHTSVIHYHLRHTLLPPSYTTISVIRHTERELEVITKRDLEVIAKRKLEMTPARADGATSVIHYHLRHTLRYSSPATEVLMAALAAYAATLITH